MESKADYFSLDNLNELVGVEAHLDFAEGLIRKYGGIGQGTLGDGADWEKIRRQLEQIRRKQKEKTLNLSVIGEFSTGKSTFINALAGKDFLVCGAMQGITAASTIISCSDRYRIVLAYGNAGEEQQYGYPGLDSMKKALSVFTTEPEKARQLKWVRVGLPSEYLDNSFCIIDTPGTNVNEAWHEEVTVRTLQELSDLSIVLISGEKPAPSSLLDFIRTHLGALLSKCVFVVTMLDRIRAREREGILQYIRMKLKEELELEEPVVLPYVSPFVLVKKEKKEQGIVWEPEGQEDRELLSASLETEKRLLEHMAKQRTIAQTKKLTLLIDVMYQSIAARLAGSRSSCEGRLALLERTKQTNLEEFVRREKQVRCGRFEASAEKIRGKLEDLLSRRSEEARRGILQGLDKYGTSEKIRDYINSGLCADCSNRAEAMVAEAEREYSSVRKLFEEEMADFEHAFRQLYKTMNILPVDMARPEYNLPATVRVETADLGKSAKDYVLQQIAKENVACGGGAVAGAALGSAIFPGVGTVIGGLVGFFVGAGKGVNVAKTREECKKKLAPRLEAYFDSVSDNVLSSAEAYIRRIRDFLSEKMDQYLRTYRMEVERQIRENTSQTAQIRARIAELEKDMSAIRNRKGLLQSAMEQLNRL